MILLCLKFALIMRYNGTKNSKHQRPTFEMYTTTLVTIRDLVRDTTFKSGMCPSELRTLRRYVELNFSSDFGRSADAFINLMYVSDS